MYRRFFLLIIAFFIGINAAHAEEAEWMPDPALREAVREKLGIPADTPLTQADVQEHLVRLQAINKGIVDLTGLEHATDLWFLDLPRNKISDLSPLSGLTKLGFLALNNNQISDLSPLAGLPNLEVLRLGNNQITDVSPLAGLVNLKVLSVSHNQISDLSPLAGLPNLENLWIQGNLDKEFPATLPLSDAQEAHWMPDPALRKAVRGELGIPVSRPLTQAYLQEHLVGLHAINKGIVDLTGLEHATDLQFLGLIGNKISDLSPLSGLTKLVFLNLGGNQISDLRPLAGLTHLEFLHIPNNQIEDLSPLEGLANLKDLNLINNPILDLSPLLVLENLEDLRFNDFRDRDIASTIPISKLKQFGYDETCDLERIPSISERIENREYPSVFAAWGNIINLPNLSSRERLAYHDLFFSSKIFDSMKWLPTPEGVKVFMHAESAKGKREELLSLNPNMLLLVPMHYGGAEYWQHPEDWPYWLRDESGNRIVGDIDGEVFFYDYTLPEVQDIVVQQAVGFAKCGLFDGILFDNWREDDPHNKEIAHYYAHDILEASITLLRRVREAVGDDFLILVNSNDTKVPRSAPYVNGMFMETIGSRLHGYNHQHLVKIESTLLWGEQHLRAPQINCLEGWRLGGEPLDSPRNQQWMRLFTTMSLAFSDGYVLFANTYLKGHTHYWYSFWDADLGRPIGAKGQTYESINGLFIREFTNGWAVYNRSGEAQEISLPIQTIGVESGITSRTHTVPDLDGEIYLKQETEPSPDVNGDDVVNVLDLVLVANAFGEAEPDLNGNGVVNILDLVLVANAFGNP